MPVVKKRNQQTETRLLLESPDPVDLPPASIADNAVLVQFENSTFIPELLQTLRAGSMAEPVPVMLDGSTFAVHGDNEHSGPRFGTPQVRRCGPLTAFR